MGLDMYLTAEYFVWEHGEEAENAAKIRSAVKEALGNVTRKVTGITAEVAYWRKANAIHQWFVENVQDGVDECQRAYVSREQLQELLDTVKAVLANTDEAGELLPPQAGFFFGSTEIDEWYIEDMKNTVEMLTEALDEEKYPAGSWDYYYQSSW